MLEIQARRQVADDGDGSRDRGGLDLPGAKRLIHLQLQRCVDWPICNQDIAEFRKRATEIEAAGIKEMIVTYFEGNRHSRIRQCGNEGCSHFFDDATENAKRRSCSVGAAGP